MLGVALRNRCVRTVQMLLVAGLALGCGSSDDGGTSPHKKPDAGDSGTGGNAGTAGDGSVSDAPSDGSLDGGDAGCTTGFVSCGGQCVAVDDPAYGCGDASCKPCSTSNATAVCKSGACAIDKCNTGYADCNQSAADGCESQLDADPQNCGSCGTPCVEPHATASCSAGKCGVASCDNGYSDCNTDPIDGCEVNVGGDPKNCGSCAKVCPVTGGTPICTSGTCGYSNCALGTGECDGNPATVCETNLDTDANNCGFCGNACSLANASAACTAGSCTVTACNTGYADCDGNPANGCEINVGTSSANCGGCAKACTNPNGQTACVSSVCTPTCTSGFADCDGNPANGCETATNTDPANCGACSAACSSANGTAGCTAGQCSIACSAGFGNCDGNVGNGCETQLDSTSNCGACGQACNPTNGTGNCSTGSCAITSCSPGYADCDNTAGNGCEVNISQDPAHCGACSTVCNSTHGTASCSSGACGIVCSAGFGNCDNNAANGCEVDLTQTTTSCGACGTACTNANGTTSCVASKCTPVCAAGFSDCNSNANDGCETNVNQSVNNCGTCGKVCSCPSGTPNCVAGACGCASCAAGTGDCDGNTANGCETNTQTSVGNCGTCGNACNGTNGTPSCAAGTCSIACNTGFGNCDNNAGNGCETNTQTSVSNCGTCGTACNATNGTASCAAGACSITCNAGFGNCDNNAGTGCEVNLGTSTSNCGSCGTACSNAHGSTACSAGACVPSCAAGFGDCNGNVNDGCETSLTTLTNCGACGVGCSRPNASASCATGTCQLGTCNSGFDNCDGNAGNGCETALNTTSNCGACNATCSNAHGTTACNSGVCAPSCAAGWGDCNGNLADGCETSLTTTSNCGSCGTGCSLANATASCASGTCQVATCNSGFGNCDGNQANGCETNIQTSVSNCGGCGTVCSNANGTPSCGGGLCAISCNPGWANCDGNAQSNGCEVNLNTDNSHCGTCVKVCTAGQTCVGGICQSTPVCGNGTIESGEQCDDANTKNDDGCNATCKYEQVQRVNLLQVQRTSPSPSFCAPTTNQFGKALSSSAQTSFNDSLTTDINAGVLNTLMDFLGLDDLTGVTDASLQVGVANATLDPKKGTWTPPGAIDWWYLANAADIDANGIPLYQLSPAAISARILTGGPSTIVLNYSGSPLKMLGARLKATIGTTTSVPAPPPSALASGLTTFQTMAANSTGQGLCGNITVGSLAAMPAPQALTIGGSNACGKCSSGSLQYTYCGAGNPVGPGCNSLLDVVVGGCKVLACIVTVITPEQPDVGTGGNPPAPLSNNTGNLNKVSVSQPDDAYSSYFYFTSTRGHITNNLP